MEKKNNYNKEFPDLSVNISKIKFPNPIILASGILGISYSSMLALEREGIGGITTKSIGPELKVGNPNPSIIGLGNDTFLNAVGLANPGIDYFAGEIKEIKKHISIPLIVSVFGDSIESFINVAKKAAMAGADAIEVNISCPHSNVSFIGSDPNLTYEYVSKVKNEIEIPLFVKLNPNVTDIVQIGKAAMEAGADALVAINTIKAMIIDINVKKPVLSNKIGGLSGRAIKPIGIRNVFELYKSIKIPIIGCGGIFEWQDIIEYFMAGASAVEVGSVLTYGYEVIRNLNLGIKNYIIQNGFSSLSELVGIAHK